LALRFLVVIEVMTKHSKCHFFLGHSDVNDGFAAQYLRGMARIMRRHVLDWRSRRCLNIVLFVIMLWIVLNYVKHGMYVCEQC